MISESNDEINADWIVEVACPFCGEVVLEATDFSKLPEDMDDDEREEIECSEELIYACEHLAFSSDWAYAGSEIYDDWKKEMSIFARAINKKENTPQKVTKQNVAKIIDDYRMAYREEALKSLAEEALPKYDFAFINEFVCKNDGIDGRGGADYGLIFLCEKDTTRQRSSGK